MDNWKVQFTAKATLQGNMEKPSYAEMVNFLFGTLEMKCEDIKCMHLSVSGREIYFRCYNEETMRKIVDNFDGAPFKFENGVVARVQMSQESEMLKYVRVWGIPPDAPDGDVARFFGNYGDVKRVVRERYPRDLNCPIETGVRGIHMDLRQELPHFMHIRNFRIKVHYEGQKERCFGCGSTEHIRADCPKKSFTPASRVATMGNMVNLNSLLRDKDTPVRPVTSVAPAPLAQPMPVTSANTFANIASAMHEVEIVSQTIAEPPAPTPPPVSPKIRRPVTRQSRSRGGPRSSPPIRDRSRRSGDSSSGSRSRPERPRNLPLETIAKGSSYKETFNYFSTLAAKENTSKDETITEGLRIDELFVDTN
jgi:hypothetical protein